MKTMYTEERIAEARLKAEDFRAKQKLGYDIKVALAEKTAKVFYDTVRGSGFRTEYDKVPKSYACHVSVGGLDSITLLLFLRAIGIDIPAVSVSSLEDKSIRRIHKQLGVTSLQPVMAKSRILKEFGFPVISKETACKISLLQHPSDKNATVRHAIMTGETGEYGGNRKGTRMKMSQKWLNKFGGLENEKYGTRYQTAPFLVSDKCCYYLKEKPCNDYSRKNNSYPYLGLMASEFGRRERSLALNGCNYFSKGTVRSAPFAIFSRQDILQLALDLNTPVPEIYGTIERKPDGTLYTTRAQRTGCSMCGFGIHLEPRPHRFDRLRESSPKEWAFWMYDMGWGEVLSYIGVDWEDGYV